MEKNVENDKNKIFDDSFDFELIYSNDIAKLKQYDEQKNQISTSMVGESKDINNDLSNENSNNFSEIIIDKKPNIENKEIKINKEKFYISLDHKNHLLKNNPEVSEELYKKIKIKNDKSDIIKNLNEISESIKLNLLNDIFPDINQDFFSISYDIAKQLRKDNIIAKKNVEKNLDFFFYDLTRFTEIVLDKNSIKHLGAVIGFIYYRIKKFGVKDGNSFIKAVNKIIRDKLDIIDIINTDMLLNININNLNKVNYFKNKRKKYFIIPELIFLVNLFEGAHTIIFDLRYPREYNKNFFFLYFICILNLPYIAKNIKTIKFNYFNTNLIQNRENYYLKKFEKFFSFKKNMKNKILNKQQFEIKYDSFLTEYNLIDMKTGINIQSRISANTTNTFNKSQKSLININNTERYNNSVSIERSIISELFLLIIFIFLSIYKYENLENFNLILVDSFYSEFSAFLKNQYHIKTNNFHILDIIHNKLIELNGLNLEINSFDLITFNELLRIILKSTASNLQLSFFTSEISYSSEFLYNIYYQNIKRKFIKENYTNKNNLKFNDEFFKLIYPYFLKNLKIIFQIIKKKKLNSLGIIFNIPTAILNKEKYIIIIIKFILNIFLLYFDDADSKLTKLTISSSSLVINGAKYLFFEEFLQNLNIKNKNLLNMNIKLKFYNLKYIHKFIHEKLKIIDIGDFDIFSLKYLVDNISQYRFIRNNSLQKLSISLNKTILNLNEEIKIIFAKLFNIKMQNLSLYLFTNIKIEINEFEEIYHMLNNNWINDFHLSFNQESTDIIKFYVSRNQSVKYIYPKEPDYSKTGNVLDVINGKEEKILADFVEINYCLDKAINKAKGSNSIDFYSRKNIISTIFSYLYMLKKTIIKFYEKKC